MNIFRTATRNDVDAIAALTSSAGRGLTTVPKDKDDVAAYIDESLRFLAGVKTANRLLFVVEQERRIVGISGIIPQLGIGRPFYSFKRSRHSRRSTQSNLAVTYETLQLTNDFEGCTELATLFLSPEARGAGLGRLLSLGRLAFIHANRAMFADKLVAEIRGWFDETDMSPFWTHLTSKFIDCDFDIADRLSLSDGQFISDLLPSLPIMLNLLPRRLIESIGRPNDQSVGAIRLLESAGFQHTDLCHIFDGGPALECATDHTIISQTAAPFEAKTSFIEDADTLLFVGEGAMFQATMARANAMKLCASSLVDSSQPGDIVYSADFIRNKQRFFDTVYG